MGFSVETKIEMDEISFDKDLWRFVGNQYKNIIAKAKGGFLSTPPKKFFLESDVKEKYVNFVQKHFADLIDELSDGELDWNNEHSKLFFELMKERYKISNADCLQSILYFQLFLQMTGVDQFITNHGANTPDEVFKNIAYLMLSNEQSDNNLSPTWGYIIKRYATDNNIKTGLLSSPIKEVKKHLKTLKLNQFEDDLKNEKIRSSKTVSEKIIFLKKKEFFEKAGGLGLDTNIENYNVVGIDHSRDSRADRYYRKHLTSAMLKAFEGKCVKCEEHHTGLELDHFWHPKSSGGNFVMRHKEQGYINNCIPLCRSCNSSKGKKDILEFFDESELDRIIPLSQSLNSQVNTIFTDFKDEEIEDAA